MNISINQVPHELPEGATVADAVAAIEARPPFAVAVNTTFVPNTRYAAHACSLATAWRSSRRSLAAEVAETPSKWLLAPTKHAPAAIKIIVIQ